MEERQTDYETDTHFLSLSPLPPPPPPPPCVTGHHGNVCSSGGKSKVQVLLPAAVAG